MLIVTDTRQCIATFRCVLQVVEFCVSASDCHNCGSTCIICVYGGGPSIVYSDGMCQWEIPAP